MKYQRRAFEKLTNRSDYFKDEHYCNGMKIPNARLKGETGKKNFTFLVGVIERIVFTVQQLYYSCQGYKWTRNESVICSNFIFK